MQLLVAAVATGGCAGDAPGIGMVVRDSAQVTIVETQLPVEDSLVGWGIRSEPLLRVGSPDGPFEVQFVNFAGMWIGRQGRLVVGDRASRSVRVFSEMGAHLFEFGGGGDGPGEFRHLTTIDPYRGDSVLVWDGAARRVSIFDRDGNLGRVFGVEFPEARQQGSGHQSFRMDSDFVGSFEDGSVLFTSPVFLWLEPGDRRVFDVDLLLYTQDGERVRSIGRHIRGEWMSLPSGLPVATPFPRPFLIRVAGSEIIIGASQEYEIRVHSWTGQLQRLIRLKGTERRVQARDRQVFRDNQQQRFADQYPEGELERHLAQIVFPVWHPPYANMIVDELGFLWVRDPEVPRRDASTPWRLFDQRGRYLGLLELPQGLVVHHIGRELILGAGTDDLDVPVIEVYQLDRR